MESEIRIILTQAVNEPDHPRDLFATPVDRFGAVGGVKLDLPPRSTRLRRVLACIREHEGR
jgi:plasmid stability protein